MAQLKNFENFFGKLAKTIAESFAVAIIFVDLWIFFSGILFIAGFGLSIPIMKNLFFTPFTGAILTFAVCRIFTKVFKFSWQN